MPYSSHINNRCCVNGKPEGVNHPWRLALNIKGLNNIDGYNVNMPKLKSLFCLLFSLLSFTGEHVSHNIPSSSISFVSALHTNQHIVKSQQVEQEAVRKQNSLEVVENQEVEQQILLKNSLQVVERQQVEEQNSLEAVDLPEVDQQQPRSVIVPTPPLNLQDLE